MEDKDCRRISRKLEKGGFKEFTNELVEDYKGRRYLVTDVEYKRQLDLRTKSPEKELMLNIAHEILYNNLGGLTEKQKDVIIGTINEKSLRRIGQDMGLTHSTVREHLKAAKKKLAMYINKTKEVLKEEI